MYPIIGPDRYGNTRFGWISRQGSTTIEPCFGFGRRFSEGLAAATLQEDETNLGYIDGTGAFVIDPRYEIALTFHSGLGTIRTSDSALHRGGFGFIDHSGNAICPPAYDAAFPGKDLCGVQRGPRWGFMNHAGEIVIPFDFTSVHSFVDDIAAAAKGERWGFIDRSGQWVIEPEFAYAQGFVDGWAVAWPKQRGRPPVILISKTGERKTLPFTHVGLYREGRVPFQAVDRGPNGLLGPMGFLDENFEVVVEARYRRLLPYSEGFACVGDRGCYHYIDRLGNPAFSLVFEDVCPFWEGLARVRTRDRIGYIDTSGNWVWSSVVSKLGDEAVMRWMHDQ